MGAAGDTSCNRRFAIRQLLRPPLALICVSKWSTNPALKALFCGGRPAGRAGNVREASILEKAGYSLRGVGDFSSV